MIERMPAVTVAALKQGETVIVSSTKGATSGDVTAILLLANADFLIRMASQQQAAAGQQRGQGAGMGGMMGGGAGGMMGGGDFGAMLPGFTQ
jgi:hypothetical protein